MLQTSNAPNPIRIEEGLIVPIKITSVDVEVTHASGTRADVTARMQFTALENGYPMFDFTPTVLSLSLDGNGLDKSELATYHHREAAVPYPIATFRVLRKSLRKGQSYELAIAYKLSLNNISETVSKDSDPFSSSINFLTFMRDVTMDGEVMNGRKLLDQWFPANFEFDQYPIRIHISSTNDKVFKTYTNGVLELTSPREISISFPKFFNASAPYLHIFEPEKSTYRERRWKYASIDGRDIPILLYTDVPAQAEYLIQQAVQQTNAAFTFMESELAPYPYDSLTLFIKDGLSGGQEYSGAIVAGPLSVRHEVIHMWVGRSIFPANGNAGWIDESITTWYENSKSAPGGILDQRNRLSGFSEYWRVTSEDAYQAGSAFIDAVYRLDSGHHSRSMQLFDEYLEKFFQAKKFLTYTHEEFIRGLKENMGASYGARIDELLERYVYLSVPHLPPPTDPGFSPPRKQSQDKGQSAFPARSSL